MDKQQQDQQQPEMEQQQEQPVVSEPVQENTGSENAGAGNQDAESNKAMAIIGYIIPILFFIPLLGEETKKSPFAKFHANQQLLLLLAAVAVNIIGSIIPVLGWFIILPLGSITLIVLAIMGIINAAKGKMEKLPLIGSYELIK